MFKRNLKFFLSFAVLIIPLSAKADNTPQNIDNVLQETANELNQHLTIPYKVTILENNKHKIDKMLLKKIDGNKDYNIYNLLNAEDYIKKMELNGWTVKTVALLSNINGHESVYENTHSRTILTKDKNETIPNMITFGTTIKIINLDKDTINLKVNKSWVKNDSDISNMDSDGYNLESNFMTKQYKKFVIEGINDDTGQIIILEKL